MLAWDGGSPCVEWGGSGVDENDIPEQVDHGRRRFLSTAGAAALAVGAAGLGMTGIADAQAGRTTPADLPKPGTSASFGPVRQVKAGVLNTGYVAARPRAVR